MKIKLKVSELKEALAITQKTVGKPRAINNLDNVAFIFKLDSVPSIISGNGAIQSSVKVVDATVDEDTEFMVNFVKIFSVVKTLPDDKYLTLTLKDGKIKTSCGKSRSTISAMPVDAYPFIETITPDGTIENSEEFISAFGKVSYAAAKDHAKMKSLNGITVTGDGNQLSILASDTHQVGAYSFPSGFSGSFILPYGSISAFKSFLPSTEVIQSNGKK